MPGPPTGHPGPPTGQSRPATKNDTWIGIASFIPDSSHPDCPARWPRCHILVPTEVEAKRRNTSTWFDNRRDAVRPRPGLARRMHTSARMQLRTRPDAFARSLVDAVTVGPFLTTLQSMRQARLRSARPTAPMPEPAPMPMPVAAPKAA